MPTKEPTELNAARDAETSAPAAPIGTDRISWALVALLILLGIGITLAVLIRGPRRHPPQPFWTIPGADVARGREAIMRHGCGACHVIPNIRHANARVGPKLEDFREQMYIAGRLPNTPENLIAWIVNPKHFDPENAMPNLGVTEPEARDIAAFLYSIR